MEIDENRKTYSFGQFRDSLDKSKTGHYKADPPKNWVRKVMRELCTPDTFTGDEAC